MHLPADGAERLQLDVSEAVGGIGQQHIQDRGLHPDGVRALSGRERAQDLRRALIRHALQVPQGLELLRGQIKDPGAENALGPDLEENLELADRVGDSVGPDREVDDDGAQDHLGVAELGHDGPAGDGLSHSPAAAFGQLEEPPGRQEPGDRTDDRSPPIIHDGGSLAGPGPASYEVSAIWTASHSSGHFLLNEPRRMFMAGAPSCWPVGSARRCGRARSGAGPAPARAPRLPD